MQCGALEVMFCSWLENAVVMLHQSWTNPQIRRPGPAHVFVARPAQPKSGLARPTSKIRKPLGRPGPLADVEDQRLSVELIWMLKMP